MKIRIIKEGSKRSKRRALVQEEKGSIKISLPPEGPERLLAEKLLEALREVVPDLNLVKAIEDTQDHDALDLYDEVTYLNEWVWPMLKSFNNSALSDIPEKERKAAEWEMMGAMDMPRLTRNKNRAGFYVRTGASWDFDGVEGLSVRYSSFPEHLTIEAI